VSYADPCNWLLSGPITKLAAKRASTIQAALNGDIGIAIASTTVTKGIRRKFVPARSWCRNAGDTASQIKRIADATYHRRILTFDAARTAYCQASRGRESLRDSTLLLKMATSIEAPALIRAAKTVSLIPPVSLLQKMVRA